MLSRQLAFLFITSLSASPMEAKKLRAAAVRQALLRTAKRRLLPTAQELELLTHYILGHLSLEQANEQLRSWGRALRLA